jgi:hypothetical protein
MKKVPRDAENLDRNCCSSIPSRFKPSTEGPVWTEEEHSSTRTSWGAEFSKGSKMEKNMNTVKAPTDDIYYVSAADVADKIIDHMRRGLDPLLFSSSPSAPISVGSMWRTRARRYLD